MLWGILAIVVAIALMAIPILLACYVVSTLARYPKHLVGNFITAWIWTLTTTIQTIILLDSHAKDPVRHVIVFVAGSAMVASWAQLSQRRQGDLLSLSRQSIAVRLLVQSFWGPVSLAVLVIGIRIAGQKVFENAVEQRNVPMAITLRDHELGNPHYDTLSQGLIRAIKRQDPDTVAAYLAVGTPTNPSSYTAYSNAMQQAVQRDNSRITEMLLNHGDSANQLIFGDSRSLLHLAVESGKVDQVRTLLRHGADRNAVDNEGRTPSEIAEKRGDRRIFALLMQPVVPSEKPNEKRE